MTPPEMTMAVNTGPPHQWIDSVEMSFFVDFGVIFLILEFKSRSNERAMIKTWQAAQIIRATLSQAAGKHCIIFVSAVKLKASLSSTRSA